MRIHEIVLVPGAGHANGVSYCRGHALPHVAEIDVIEPYMKAIADELDEFGVRYRIHGVRGLSEADRGRAIFPHSLVVHCRVGWLAPSKEPETNISRVFYGPSALNLGREMSDVIGEWGSLYNFGHRQARHVTDPKDSLINIPETLGIRIEPFALNGPGLDNYLVQHKSLGRDIGRSLIDFLKTGGDHARSRRPSTIIF